MIWEVVKGLWKSTIAWLVILPKDFWEWFKKQVIKAVLKKVEGWLKKLADKL